MTLVQGLGAGSEKEGPAWETFLATYDLPLRAYARGLGIAAADLDDLMQEVYVRISRAVSRFDLSPESGRFRSWLFTIVRNRALNHFRTRKRKPANFARTSSGDERIAGLAAAAGPESRWEADFQRHRFQCACRSVRPRVSAQSWEVFWRTAVLGESNGEVAEEIGMKPGAAYVARSRVTAKIRDALEELPTLL